MCTKSGFGHDLPAYIYLFPHVRGDETRLITCTLCITFGKLILLTCIMIVFILFQGMRCSIALFSPAYYLKQGRSAAMNMYK
jgi:hypothetical protein